MSEGLKKRGAASSRGEADRFFLNSTISLENEIVAQGLMNTTYHQGYPGYPRSWLSPYAIVLYTSIA
jgi:hypothetical protein